MIYKDNNINEAVNLLQQGEIIVYPTDTLYGFGVDATNSDAIMRLNKIKNRKQPYSIIVNSFDMLNKYVIMPNIKKFDLKKYFPGPYTLIFLKNKSNLSDLVSLDLNTVGVRIPDFSFPCDIVSKLDKPIITTSVNFHNSKPLRDIESIKNSFSNISIFESSKFIGEKLGSTIIDVSNNKFKILRKGSGKII